MKDREANRSSDTDAGASIPGGTDAKSENERLASFFAGLSKKGDPSAADSLRGS